MEKKNPMSRFRRRSKARSLAVLWFAVAALPASGGLAAQDYAASEMRLENACTDCRAEALVRWDQNGLKCETAVETSGSRISVDLSGKRFAAKNVRTGCILTPGTEVWMRVEIASGDSEECRVSDAKVRFDPKGGAVRYRLSGSPGSASCRAVGKPDSLYSAR
jgi:hypothetical protein